MLAIFDQADRCRFLRSTLKGRFLVAVLYAPLDDFRIEAGCVNELVAIVVDGSDSRRVTSSIEYCFYLGCCVGIKRKPTFASSQDDVKCAPNLRRRRLFLKYLETLA